MRPFDPFTTNLYRLHQVTRDSQPLAAFPVANLELPVASSTRPTTVPTSLDAASWFDGSRPVDQAALGQILEGGLAAARSTWEASPEGPSLHNLTILAHLTLFGNDGSPRVWKEVFTGYCRLYREAHEDDIAQDGYLELARALKAQLMEQATAAVARSDASGMRWCIDILAAGLTPAAFEECAHTLLADELERFNMACATIRQRVLAQGDQINLTGLQLEAAQIRTHLVPLARFLTASSLPGSTAAQEVGQKVCLLWRTLARTGTPDVETFQLEAMEEAYLWAYGFKDLLAEILPELEHLRWRGRSLEARRPTSETVAERRLSTRAIVGGGLALAVLALVISAGMGTHSLSSGPVAVDRQISDTVNEIRPVAEELSNLDRQLRGRTEAQEPDLWKRRARLKEKHSRLLTQLESLDKLHRHMLKDSNH